MTEERYDGARVWAEFPDPAEENQRVRADLTWLTSSWTCIFGNGCPGIDSENPDVGCCVLGAHFTGDEDRDHVASVVEDLGEDEWQYYDLGRDGAWLTQDDDGEQKTAVVDGACIFHNRPGFPAGAGCALHQHAVSEGRAAWSDKPEVCWQVPIRRSYRDVTLPDGSEWQEVCISEFDRRSWGEGGHDLDWYCSTAPAAHVGAVPVYVSQEPELRELLGDEAYDVLVEHCEAHLAAVRALRAAPEGRRMLPLMVHPATLAAEGQ